MSPWRLIGFAFLLFGLAACSQASGMFGGSSTLPVDPADPCGAQRRAFAQGQNFFAEKIISGAAEGAIKSALNGVMSGGGAGGGSFWNQALNGGLAGAKAGYWEAVQQQHVDQQQLAQTVNGDIQRESKAIDHTAAAFASLRTCRLAQANQIKSAARAHRIDRAEAKRQLDTEHEWFGQEIAAAQQAGLNMQRRDEQFAYAAENLRQGGKAPGSAGSSHGGSHGGSAKAVDVAATETLPQKRNSFESDVNTAVAENSTAFSLDTSGSFLIQARRYA
ncbi:MAG: hypothetical protein JOZ42_16825 [Acetobacteraceae bacterium]|nr:hypothetical protein [Acetobacteraceae bacterium]